MYRTITGIMDRFRGSVFHCRWLTLAVKYTV